MNTLQTITEALRQAQSKNIVIDHGACSTIINNGNVVKVNWLGACELYFQTNVVSEVLQHLNEDWTWFYRFNLGFNQGRHLDVLDKDNHVIGPDTVSQSAVKLAREFGLFR